MRSNKCGYGQHIAYAPIVILICLTIVVPFLGSARPALAATADSFAFPVGYPDGQGYNNTAGLGFLATGVQGIHPGEDWNENCGYDCDLGKPVVAAANGRVIDASYYTCWGRIIQIEHTLPDSTHVWTQYAHLNTISVTSGQDVQKGQPIGTIGKGDSNSLVL